MIKIKKALKAEVKTSYSLPFALNNKIVECARANSVSQAEVVRQVLHKAFDKTEAA